MNPILIHVDVHQKVGKGLLHAHKRKKKFISRNENANPVSHIICKYFIQGFASLSGWLSDTWDNFYVNLIDQLILLSAPHPFTHGDMCLAIKMDSIRTRRQTSLLPAKGGLELTP